jgi:serine/threonine protein kinase/tetratricopeptide (TPR) repeat protein
MAIVYLANDLRHNRPVAIKVLRDEFTSAVGPDRFLREIETAARLQHPHILPIYDSGNAAGVLYYVMPYVEGESLRERLHRDKRIDPKIAMRLGLEVAEALSYAHSLGVVHRDIKPENILLFREHAMVADFGIAKVQESSQSVNLTQDGAGLGTPAYMSPEQAFGEADVDGRSDLYSLACVMYEMLEGTLPFDGANTMQILAAKARGNTREMKHTLDRIPAHVSHAISRALSREPHERHGAVSEFAEALGTTGTYRAGTAPRKSMPVKREHSVAVLPFSNAGSGTEDDFLSDGISEELTHLLSKLQGLRVVARTSAFAFKGVQADARTIGTTLGVKSLLSGSVRRLGARMRITADLIDVDTGFSVWSERYDRELADVFDIQDEITHAIVDALKVNLLGEVEPVVSKGSGRRRFVEAPTANIEAYETYLKGRFFWNQRTESALRQSVAQLERAVQLDPEFLLAHTGIADAYITLAIYGVMRPDEAMPRAQSAAERALRIDPHFSEALTARGSVRALYRYEHAASEQDFLQAIDAREQYATTHQWYAMHLLAPQQRFTEARAQLARARELDPLSAVIGASNGVLRFFQRDYEQAIAELLMVLERSPGFDLAEYFLGQVYSAVGEWALAEELLGRCAVKSGRSPEVVSALAVAQAGAGDRAQAQAIVTDLIVRSETRYVSPALIAQVQVALGEHEPALQALERAAEMRATEVTLLASRPVFDPLRGDARFARIVQKATGVTI